MCSDGTEGIRALSQKKRTYIVAQDEETSTIYGMPRAIAATGLCNSIVPISQVADKIVENVGVL